MIILGLIALIHAILMIWLGITWNRIGVYNAQKGERLFISIIVPVRNEALNISRLMEDLAQQDYDADQFEVIIINDHSSDQTTDIVQSKIREVGEHFRMVHLTDEAGKKSAAAKGVSEAKGDYILCTDGDCRVPKSWISTYVAFFREHQPYMVSGPVKMVGPRFFDRVQAIDFSALLVFGASTLHRGMATTCNGANMAYRKDIFEEVDGYSGNKQLASGDDEFLLQKIFAKYPSKVLFLKSPTAIVETLPKQSLKEFAQQRMRWTSKWRFYDDFFMRLSWVFTYLDFMSVFVVAGLMISGYLYPWAGLLILAVRWLAESWYLYGPAKFLKLSGNWFHMWTVSFIYPFYVLFLGFASIFGSYSWKGRRYG